LPTLESWAVSKHESSPGGAALLRFAYCKFADHYLLGQRSSIFSRMRLAFSIASAMAHSGAGHGLSPRVRPLSFWTLLST
jgi:hypothetical protein